MTRNPVFAATLIRWGAVALLSLSFLALATRAASASGGADAGRPAVHADAPVPPAPPTPPATGALPEAVLAQATEPPAPADRPTPFPPRPPRPPALPEMPGFPGMMAGPVGPLSTAMAATDRYVYVLRGNTLYAFDARTLRQAASTTLEPPATPARDRQPRPGPGALPGPVPEPLAPAPPLRPDQPEALPALPEGGPQLDPGGRGGLAPGRGLDGFGGRALPEGPGLFGRPGFNGFRPFGGEPGLFRGFDGDQPVRFFQAMGGLPAPPTSMTATPQYVYVLRGNTLYSFDARTLRQVGRTTIEAPRPRADDRVPAPPPPADER
jgi:hypothetical protein